MSLGDASTGDDSGSALEVPLRQPITGAGVPPTPAPQLYEIFEELPTYQPAALFPEMKGNLQDSVADERLAPKPSIVEAASARVAAQSTSYVPGSRHDLPIDPITTPEATAILRAAGWPEPWIPDILTIAACESSGGKRDADGALFHPGEAGDGGNSLGWLQLWSGWWRAAGEDLERWFDPLVNARVGLYIRTVRGRFGGNGGWSCADRFGIT